MHAPRPSRSLRASCAGTALLGALVFTTIPIHAYAVDGVWGRTMPPRGMESPVGVLDERNDRLVIHLANEYESWRPETWFVRLGDTPRWELAPTSGTEPPPSYGERAVLDPVRRRMLVLGGTSNSGLLVVYALPLDGVPAWRQLATAGLDPGARSHFGVTYDSTQDRLYVHGGIPVGASAPLGDLWALDLAGTPTWHRVVVADSAPAARSSHALVYDPDRHRLILSGGDLVWNNCDYNDTWELTLDGAPSWHLLTTSGLGYRSHHAMVYDPRRGGPVVFGGIRSWRLVSDVLVWSDSPSPHWELRSGSGVSVPGRWNHLGVLDAKRDRLLLYGGSAEPDDRVYAVTLDGIASTRSVAVPGAPASQPSALRAVVADAPRERVIAVDAAQRTWALDLHDPTAWTQLPSSGQPAAAALVYDAGHDRILGFDLASTPRVTSMSLTGWADWVDLTPAGSPPTARTGMAVAYDPVRNRVLVFGGTDPVLGKLADVWALDLLGAPVWTPVSVGGTPPIPCSGAQLVYDPESDSMTLFGGSYTYTPSTETRLQLGPTPSGPAPRWVTVGSYGRWPASAIATYDPTRHRFVTLSPSGAYLYYQAVLASVLPQNLAGADLSLLGPSHSGRFPQALIADPDRSRVLVIGADDGTAPVSWFTWASALLDADGGPALPTALDFATPRPNPARSDVALSFALPRAGRVSLRVHDLAGRVLRTLVDGDLAAGPHAARWDVREAGGHRVAPGVYFAELRHGTDRQVRRVVVLE